MGGYDKAAGPPQGSPLAALLDLPRAYRSRIDLGRLLRTRVAMTDDIGRGIPN